MSQTGSSDGVSPMSASNLPGLTSSAPPRSTAQSRSSSTGRAGAFNTRGLRSRSFQPTARGSHQSRPRVRQPYTPRAHSSSHLGLRGSPPFQPPQVTVTQQGRSRSSSPSTRTSTLPITQTSSLSQGGEIGPLILASTKKIEGYCGALIQQQKKQLSEMNELKQMVEKLQKKGFTIKGSTYELSLRRAVANLFCTSLTRYPLTEELQSAIRRVLPREELEKTFVVEACLKESSTLLSSFRTEERRRVLGGKPVESLCHLPTEELAKNIMLYLKAPTNEEVEDSYIKHLALLRKYVRTNPGCIAQKNFHIGYKNWVNATYPAGELTIEEWGDITTEDATHPYQTHPLTDIQPSGVDDSGAGGFPGGVDDSGAGGFPGDLSPYYETPEDHSQVFSPSTVNEETYSFSGDI